MGFTRSRVPDHEILGAHRTYKFANAISKDRDCLIGSFRSYASKALADPGDPIVALALIRITTSRGEPGEEFTSPRSVRQAIAVESVPGDEQEASAETTLARVTFAWKVLRASEALAEAAEIAVLAGVTLKRLGRSDQGARSRVKGLVARGAKLGPLECDDLLLLARKYLTSSDLEAYEELLMDLRHGVYDRIGEHAELARLRPIDLDQRWDELMPNDGSTAD